MTVAHRRPSTARPRLSIVVVVYDMAREAPRTLHSLSTDYQRDVDVPYEVVIVDNGSPSPMAEGEILGHAGDFRYFHLQDPPPSPAKAMNFGVSQARADLLGLVIDGARILSPGILHHALLALTALPRAVVGTLGFHLGPTAQHLPAARDYDQLQEDRLLEEIGWPAQGYRLFEIASLAGSSAGGYFRPLNESNCLFLARELFDELGGFEERFSSPGGGFVNLDFYSRACQLPASTLVTLLGEGTFHQVHGGAITNAGIGDLEQTIHAYREEYRRIRGGDYRPPTREGVYLGRVHPSALPWIERSTSG